MQLHSPEDFTLLIYILNSQCCHHYAVTGHEGTVKEVQQQQQPQNSGTVLTVP